jgi:hypothetical protein
MVTLRHRAVKSSRRDCFEPLPELVEGSNAVLEQGAAIHCGLGSRYIAIYPGSLLRLRGKQLSIKSLPID